ncbi:hypothetical protein HID58_060875, partial [Brassica napus]
AYGAILGVPPGIRNSTNNIAAMRHIRETPITYSLSTSRSSLPLLSQSVSTHTSTFNSSNQTLTDFTMEPKNSSISNDREPCKTTAASSAHARPNRKSTASSAMVMKPNGKSAVSSAILKKPNASTAVSSAHDDQRCVSRPNRSSLEVSTGSFLGGYTKTLIGQEMILIDEEGTVIQGFVPAGRVGTYELEPGSVYKLRNFFGSRNKARYRVTDHSATVTFAWNTELKILDNPLVSIHEDRFRFHSYEEFYANCDRKVDLYDYVGHMKLVNGQTITEHTVLDEVDISDKRHLCLYLWDKAASDFCVKFKSYGSTPSVLLVTTVNPKHLGGTLALTSMASSRVFMDSDVQPSRDYLGWLSSNSDIANKINEEVVTKPETATLEELFAYIKQETTKVAWFECTTTIDDVVQGSPWYYISCGGCNSKAVKGPTSLICNNKKCGKSVVTGKLIFPHCRYLTRILVYDKSEQAVFVVLSDAGKELTGKHASELVASYFETQTITVTKIFPPEAPQPIAPLEEHAVPTTSGDILESGSDGHLRLLNQMNPSVARVADTALRILLRSECFCCGRLTGNIQPNDSKNLTEGDIYEFSGFSVIHNSRHRKLTQLPYYIQIDQKTITLNVTVNGPIFSVHNLSPQNYRNLLRLATTPTYLPDVVGQIVIIQKIKPYHPELNIDATIGLWLNRSTIVKLILCDKQVADFSILQSKKDRKFKVFIITSIIPKLFQGKLLLRSSPATNFYFNKSIDYIKHFKRQIRDHAKPCSKE